MHDALINFALHPKTIIEREEHFESCSCCTLLFFFFYRSSMSHSKIKPEKNELQGVALDHFFLRKNDGTHHSHILNWTLSTGSNKSLQKSRMKHGRPALSFGPRYFFCPNSKRANQIRLDFNTSCNCGHADHCPHSAAPMKMKSKMGLS